MNTQSDQGSAIIYQFPLRRSAARNDHAGVQPVVLGLRLPVGSAPAVAGDAWYHEAAIREADEADER